MVINKGNIADMGIYIWKYIVQKIVQLVRLNDYSPRLCHNADNEFVGNVKKPLKLEKTELSKLFVGKVILLCYGWYKIWKWKMLCYYNGGLC